uniref:Uncharacterized protein n=1 Tax=Arundo donax TaxID=35708 RepID=A0A0A9CEH5_ARUDO
MVGQVRLRLED